MAASQARGTEERELLFVEPQIFACHVHKSYHMSPHNHCTELKFSYHFTDGKIEALKCSVTCKDKSARKWQNKNNNNTGWVQSLYLPKGNMGLRSALVNMGPFPSLLPPGDCTLAQAPPGTVLVLACAGIGVS